MENQKTRYPGVHHEPYKVGTRKWTARVNHHGKNHFVGRYLTQQEAIQAHKKFKEKLIEKECEPMSLKGQ